MKLLTTIALAAIATLLTSPQLFAQCNALPLGYCAKTDTNTYNGAVPSLGAAGTVTVDPDFGAKVLRVTQNQSCGVASGHGLVPNQGAGWERAWNADDTKLLLNDSVTNGWYYMTIDPVKFTTGPCVQVTPSHLGRFPNFAWTVTNRIYGFATDNKSLAYWDTSAGNATTVFDMTAIPRFTATTPYLMEGDTNDAWFCTVNSSQDTGNQVGCYNRITGGTQVLNLGAAIFNSNNSAAVPLSGLTSADLANCVIHSILMLKGGDWLNVDLNNCTAFPKINGGDGVGIVFWQLGTNTVTYLPDYLLYSSHVAVGWKSAWINVPGAQPPCSTYNPRGWKMWFVSNVGPSSSQRYVQMNPCVTLSGGGDSHLSWENNVNDSNVNAYPVIIQTDNSTSPNTGAYMEWEIDALKTAPGLTAFNGRRFATAANGTIWRLAHTYNDAADAQCSAMTYISVNVSRDGKYVAFASDWLGQTGIGGCTNNRRLDTFVVDLSSANSSGNTTLEQPTLSPPTGLTAVVH